MAQLLDRFGRPIQRSVLAQDLSAATIGSVRTPISGTPADGLNPVRLANILRAADQGDPLQFLELAEAIEERDPHYLGVIGTRKRSVAQIEVTIEAASDDAADVDKADMVREWLERDELADELFDILDAIGKGYSFTEIIWDTSERQYRPARLEWRDPRWFRFARHDLATPVRLGDHGEELPLEPFKFIHTTMRAKSGLALRSGLARVAAWGWMFKAFTQRDWVIFTQTYGQPLRLGKYSSGASEEEKETLWRAVTNIAGDCAAIMPESMSIDFVESKNVGPGSDLYEKRSDWLDRQISKAVLGQTATTDAIAGGHAVGQEHRQVQEDIERADAKALSAILNRDLIRPWIDLEFGPQQKYPRLRIARPEAQDLTMLANAAAPMIDRGMRVSMSEMRDKFGFKDPEEHEEVLRPVEKSPSAGSPAGQKPPAGVIEAISSEFKRPKQVSGAWPQLQAEEAPVGQKIEPDPVDLLADRMEAEVQPEVGAILRQIEQMAEVATSMEELAEMMRAGLPQIGTSTLVDRLAMAFAAAHLGGRAMVEAEGG